MKLFLTLLVSVAVIQLTKACCLPDTAHLDYVWTDVRARHAGFNAQQPTGSITADFPNQKFLLTRDESGFKSTYFVDLRKGEITWQYIRSSDGYKQCFKIATEGLVGKDYQCILDDDSVTTFTHQNKYSAEVELNMYPVEAGAEIDLKNCLPARFNAKANTTEDPEGRVFFFPVFVDDFFALFEFENVTKKIDPEVLKPPCQADLFPGEPRKIPSVKVLKELLIPTNIPPSIDWDDYDPEDPMIVEYNADYTEVQRKWWTFFYARKTGNVTVDTA